MPAPYSEDIRKKRAACYKQGELSQEEVAKRFLVSASGFKRIWKSYQENGRMASNAFGRAPSHQRAYDEKPTAKGERISTWGVILSGAKDRLMF